MRVAPGLTAVGLATTLALLLLGSAPPVSGQTACNPAYLPDAAGNCVPDYGPGDVLNCADMGYGVFQLVDVNNDPYNLDTLYGPGTGWTCDGVG